MDNFNTIFENYVDGIIKSYTDNCNEKVKKLIGDTKSGYVKCKNDVENKLTELIGNKKNTASTDLLKTSAIAIPIERGSTSFFSLLSSDKEKIQSYIDELNSFLGKLRLSAEPIKDFEDFIKLIMRLVKTSQINDNFVNSAKRDDIEDILTRNSLEEYLRESIFENTKDLNFTYDFDERNISINIPDISIDSKNVVSFASKYEFEYKYEKGIISNINLKEADELPENVKELAKLLCLKTIIEKVANDNEQLLNSTVSSNIKNLYKQMNMIKSKVLSEDFNDKTIDIIVKSYKQYFNSSEEEELKQWLKDAYDSIKNTDFEEDNVTEKIKSAKLQDDNIIDGVLELPANIISTQNKYKIFFDNNKFFTFGNTDTYYYGVILDNVYQKKVIEQINNNVIDVKKMLSRTGWNYTFSNTTKEIAGVLLANDIIKEPFKTNLTAALNV